MLVRYWAMMLVDESYKSLNQCQPTLVSSSDKIPAENARSIDRGRCAWADHIEGSREPNEAGEMETRSCWTS